MKLAMNENLHYQSYKEHKGQILTAKAKENHLMEGEKLLNNPRYPVELGMIKFFSDEKISSQNQAHNIQNHRGLANKPCGVPHIMKTKFLQTVCV